MKRFAWLRSLSIALLVFSNTAAAQQTAEQLLTRMAEAYASLRSYQDVGIVNRVGDGLPAPNEIKFVTTFSRPNQLKFAWISHHPYPPLRHIEWRSVIWSDGDKASMWMMYDEPTSTAQRMESIEMAIAGATGVSGGSALTVSRLLMPEIRATSVRDIKAPIVVGIEDVEGTACHHITGTNARMGKVDLWIGTGDHLLRKVRMVIAGMTFEEIRRDIQVDAELRNDSFSFSK